MGFLMEGYVHALNTAEKCIGYALTIEEPVFPCIRVILSHGTFVNLMEDEFSEDSAEQADAHVRHAIAAATFA